MSNRHHKISLCIVSMNRLHHLAKTLPQNILDNQDYENLEFIVLDYNSTDNLGFFINDKMRGHLESGKVVYYRTDTPKYFNRSHSRNLALRLASGNIVGNLDADNFTGAGFAFYINNQFNKNEKIFMTATNKKGGVAKKDNLGRVCLKKNDFLGIGGYDERMVSYGYEDLDFINRLEMSGLKNETIEGNYFDAIYHSDRERLVNEAILSDLRGLYVNYKTPNSTDFLFLYKNGSYKRGLLINNRNYVFETAISDLQYSQMSYRYSIDISSIAKGYWVMSCNELILFKENDEHHRMENHITHLLNVKTGERSFPIINEYLIETVVMTFSQIENRVIMDENLLRQQFFVNKTGFGKDIIHRNFETSPFILS